MPVLNIRGKKNDLENNFYEDYGFIDLFHINKINFTNKTKSIINFANKVENIFFGIKKIDNQYLISDSTTIQPIKVYKPDVKKNTLKNGWQGRLCWDIPFICSYNSLIIKEKNGYLIINKLSN